MYPSSLAICCNPFAPKSAIIMLSNKIGKGAGSYDAGTAKAGAGTGPAQGAALDVGGGAQDDPHLLRPALLAHGLADFPQQRPVDRMTQELQKQARELVAQMTLEEKASLCSGKNFWESKAVPSRTAWTIFSSFPSQGPGISKSSPALMASTRSFMAPQSVMMDFEYFSEDPLVTGESAAGLIEGIQSQNVGACMKHYLANNQEKARVSSNSVVDQRAPAGL